MMTLRLSSLALVMLAIIACRSEVAPEPPPTPPAPPAVEVNHTDLLPNARQPIEGLVSGGQPSPEQLALARDAGYKTVLNLRTPGEPGLSREEIEDLGLLYLSLPIAGAADLTAENALAFAAALEEAERPALVYCGSGNRVGALFALKAFHADGKSTEEAMEIGLAAGLTRLEGAVREHLAEAEAGI